MEQENNNEITVPQELYKTLQEQEIAVDATVALTARLYLALQDAGLTQDLVHALVTDWFHYNFTSDDG